MVSPEQQRRMRIQELANWIHDAPKGRAATDRILGKGSYSWGCRVETVREYLQVLDLAGLIADDGDVIIWVGKE